MHKRLQFWVAIILVGALVLLATVLWRDVQGGKVSEVKFVLGENIVKTAEASGVPEFGVRDIQGLVSYNVNSIPKSITVRYAKPGYEIRWQPVYSLRMYADRDTHPGLLVETVDLQLDIDDMTDEQAQAFTEATISQFQKGKWQRYADPEWEVMLTGRSSILDERGNIARMLRGMDPNYKFTPEEWKVAVRGIAIWRWLGDGVLAQLTVGNIPGENGKPAYNIDLEFELLDVKLKRQAEALAKDLKDGDAKGWNSTAEHEASKLKVQARNKRLIENAIRRGDGLYVPPRQ